MPAWALALIQLAPEILAFVESIIKMVNGQGTNTQAQAAANNLIAAVQRKSVQQP